MSIIWLHVICPYSKPPHVPLSELCVRDIELTWEHIEPLLTLNRSITRHSMHIRLNPRI